MVGVLVAHDDKELAEALAEDLPATLRERVGEDTEWSAMVEEVDPADASATPAELVDAGAAEWWTTAGAWGSA